MLLRRPGAGRCSTACLCWGGFVGRGRARRNLRRRRPQRSAAGVQVSFSSGIMRRPRLSSPASRKRQ
ncbi:hypothetical protein [Lysobacter gummosus]|uniref:hypothetical protein n=1 Tax=Lysobacter gummosus TaxID=262324 RepID=UPI003625AD3B